MKDIVPVRANQFRCGAEGEIIPAQSGEFHLFVNARPQGVEHFVRGDGADSDFAVLRRNGGDPALLPQIEPGPFAVCNTAAIGPERNFVEHVSFLGDRRPEVLHCQHYITPFAGRIEILRWERQLGLRQVLAGSRVQAVDFCPVRAGAKV